MSIENPDFDPEYDDTAAPPLDFDPAYPPCEQTITCDSNEDIDAPDEVFPGGSSTADQEHMSVAEIRDSVAAWLDDYGEHLFEKVRSGEEMSGIEELAVTSTVRLRMYREARDGNIEGVDECIRSFNSLRRPDGRSFAHQAFGTSELNAEALALGSMTANAEVHRALTSEKTFFAGYPQTSEASLRPHGDHLRQLTTVLAREGYPAERFIDDYASSPYLRLAHYVSYAEQCRNAGAPPERMNHLEETIADAYMLLPDSEAVGACGLKLLSQLHDDTLRVGVFKRFIAARKAETARDGRSPSWTQYGEVLDGLLITPPSIMSPENRARVHRYARNFDKAFPDGFLAWKVDAAIAQGASPSDAVVLAQSLVPQGDGHSDHDHILKNREVDNVLGKYAYRYAMQGDFEATQTFLNAITSPSVAVEAVARCMPYASTDHQRTYLQGGEFQRVVHPELENNWRVLDAMVRNNTDDLVSAMRVLTFPPTLPYTNPSDSAERGDEYGNELRDGHILEQAFRQLDPERAITLARELRDGLSTQASLKDTYGETRRIDLYTRVCNILVRLGDIDETRRQYTAVRSQGLELPGSIRNHLGFAASIFPDSLQQR